MESPAIDENILNIIQRGITFSESTLVTVFTIESVVDFFIKTQRDQESSLHLFRKESAYGHGFSSIILEEWYNVGMRECGEEGGGHENYLH
jgi:hypothetical protein